MPSSLDIVQKFFPRVKKVVDSAQDVAVHMTARDGKIAQSKAHRQCAIAVACKRQLPIDGAVVSTRTAYFVIGTTATRFAVPENVAREIVAFDRGAGFAPGDYVLRKPQKIAKRGEGKRKQTRHRPAGKLRHRRKRTAGLRAALSNSAA